MLNAACTAQKASARPAPSIPAFVALLLSETVIGLGLGFGVRLFLMGLQTAGTMIAQSTSLSQALGNTGMDPMPAMGHLLVLGGICLAMILGLHVETVRYLLVSYEMFPIGAVPVAAEMAEWGLSGVASAFRLAFVLAAPFMIVSLLYNLTLGVINRAMPQLMVVFVGAPLITFGGLAGPTDPACRRSRVVRRARRRTPRLRAPGR